MTPADGSEVPEEVPVSRPGAVEPRSEKEKQVWDVLEKARQNVKPLVKREIEAELVTEQVLNFRLR